MAHQGIPDPLWVGQYGSILIMRVGLALSPCTRIPFSRRCARYQENLESDSVRLCTIDTLRETSACSIRFQAVRSDSTRALFHERASKRSPKVLCSVSLNKLMLIGAYSKHKDHPFRLNPVPAEQVR